MDLNEIQDPELLSMFAEYEKEFKGLEEKNKKKAKPAPKRMKFIKDDYDGGIRNLVWEYL